MSDKTKEELVKELKAKDAIIKELVEALDYIEKNPTITEWGVTKNLNHHFTAREALKSYHAQQGDGYSRSQKRRIALQKGEPMPEFDNPEDKEDVQ